jgi:polyisoprenoid-binding protein YceI
MKSTMKQKVLESSKYPTIVYESTEISADQLGEGRYRVSINGYTRL